MGVGSLAVLGATRGPGQRCGCWAPETSCRPGCSREGASAQPSALDPGLPFKPPQDPLFRFFEREVKMGARLLQDVRQDLADVVQVCEGKKKQTNYLRTLINELVKGVLSAQACPPASASLRAPQPGPGPP